VDQTPERLERSITGTTLYFPSGLGLQAINAATIAEVLSTLAAIESSQATISSGTDGAPDAKAAVGRTAFIGQLSESALSIATEIDSGVPDYQDSVAPVTLNGVASNVRSRGQLD